VDEIRAVSGIAFGLLDEAEVMPKLACARVDVNRGGEDVGALIEDRLGAVRRINERGNRHCCSFR
jgi:hypothetical protein